MNTELPYDIYMLLDPETKEVRYIGTAYCAIERFKAHLRCNNGGTPIKRWLNELKARHLQPIMKIIAGGATALDANFVERYWTRRFSKTNNLLNVNKFEDISDWDRKIMNWKRKGELV